MKTFKIDTENMGGLRRRKEESEEDFLRRKTIYEEFHRATAEYHKKERMKQLHKKMKVAAAELPYFMPQQRERRPQRFPANNMVYADVIQINGVGKRSFAVLPRQAGEGWEAYKERMAAAGYHVYQEEPGVNRHYIIVPAAPAVEQNIQVANAGGPPPRRGIPINGHGENPWQYAERMDYPAGYYFNFVETVPYGGIQMRHYRVESAHPYILNEQ